MKIDEIISRVVVVAVTMSTEIFIVLKLLSVINWKWCWVLSPLWIAMIVFGVILGIIIVGRKDNE